MSTTAFEILLNRRGDETEIPEGDFRGAIVQIVNYLKNSRGSEIELSDGTNFDPLLPSVEEFFLALAEAIRYWYYSFTSYQVFSIENNTFTIDDGIYGVYPYLEIKDGDVDPIGSQEEPEPDRKYAPYFYELTRATLPVDAEFAGILEILSAGDYPRYQEYGAILFLLDLIWWGWLTWLGEPDGRGEGDISFAVIQKLGLNSLSFKCDLAFGQRTISVYQPQTVNTYFNPVTNYKVLDASNIDFSKFTGIKDLFGKDYPTHAIAVTFGNLSEALNISDAFLRFDPPNGNQVSPIIYTCNPETDGISDRLPLLAVRASFSKNNFTFNKRVLNDNSATGIFVPVSSKTSLGFFFKAQKPSDYEGLPLNYNLQLFSGSTLLFSYYFNLSDMDNSQVLFSEI